MSASYFIFDTAFGPGGIAWGERGLKRHLLPGYDRTAVAARLSRHAAEAAGPPTDIGADVAAIVGYFAGERIEFADAIIDLSGSDGFHREVYAAARACGWGRTTTYGEIARLIGAPDKAREVGQALARNPLPLIVPCHRVLAAGDKIGGFSAPGGVATKARMLELEGIRVGADARQGSLFAPAELLSAAPPR
jgi:methylated-DNA-[protein]-cysteine S-methyltransferase